MQLSMIESAAAPSERILNLKNAVQSATPGICSERALIWRSYFREKGNRKKPAVIAIAEALSRVLAEKSIAIHPHEIIVGNFSSRRVGGSIFPELHGLPVLLDIFTFNRRKTNPLEISGRDMFRLLP